MRVQEFDYAVDILQAILWQYNDATNLLSILNQKQDWYDDYQTKFWDNGSETTHCWIDTTTGLEVCTDIPRGWRENVFDLANADLFGLAVWSIILDVPLFVRDDVVPNTMIFGFNEYVSGYSGALINDYENFDNGNFSNLNTQIALNLEEQRFLLRLRYFQLVTNGAIANNANISGIIDSNPLDINEFLYYLCSTSNIDYNGTIFVEDNLNMTLTYVFTDLFPVGLQRAIQFLDLFPRPAGVEYLWEYRPETNYLYMLNENPFLLLNGNNFSLL